MANNFNFKSEGPTVIGGKGGDGDNDADDTASTSGPTAGPTKSAPPKSSGSKGKMPPALQAALQRKLSSMNSK